MAAGPSVWCSSIVASTIRWRVSSRREGELALWVDGRTIEAPADSFVYGPRDLPHTFVVSSPEARYLIVAEPAGFETFVRSMGEPAPTLTIPPPLAPPSDLGPLVATAAEYGIEILGPPGIPV